MEFNLFVQKKQRRKMKASVCRKTMIKKCLIVVFDHYLQMSICKHMLIHQWGVYSFKFQLKTIKGHHLDAMNRKNSQLMSTMLLGAQVPFYGRLSTSLSSLEKFQAAGRGSQGCPLWPWKFPVHRVGVKVPLLRPGLFQATFWGVEAPLLGASIPHLALETILLIFLLHLLLNFNSLRLKHSNNISHE